MLIISHRGNLKGPNPETENTIPAIRAALDHGFSVEIDVQKVEDGLIYIGHDKIDDVLNITEFDEFECRKLFFHCKNPWVIRPLMELQMWGGQMETFYSYRGFDIFAHEDDPFVITTKGYIWLHHKSLGLLNDDNPMCKKAGIAVLPEVSTNFSYEVKDIGVVKSYAKQLSDNYCGICTDYPIEYGKGIELQ